MSRQHPKLNSDAEAITQIGIELRRIERCNRLAVHHKRDRLVATNDNRRHDTHHLTRSRRKVIAILT